MSKFECFLWDFIEVLLYLAIEYVENRHSGTVGYCYDISRSIWLKKSITTSMNSQWTNNKTSSDSLKTSVCMWWMFPDQKRRFECLAKIENIVNIYWVWNSHFIFWNMFLFISKECSSNIRLTSQNLTQANVHITTDSSRGKIND